MSGQFSCVKEVGYAEDVNNRYRGAMEDDKVIKDNFGGKADFFALYDGHGGRQAVDYVVAKFHDVLLEELETSSWDNVPNALDRAFLKVDDQLRVSGALNAGTTAVVCVIRAEGDEKLIYTANVGDSRAVLCRSGTAFRLSYDHKGSDKAEATRVVDAGGIVIRQRVAGQLAITRALGDHCLKTEGVIANPYVDARPLCCNDTLILASDGVWDVFSDQDAVDVIKDEESAETAAAKLVQSALQRGSRDNVSALIIKL